jgi:hypothetical protein
MMSWRVVARALPFQNVPAQACLLRGARTFARGVG